MASKPLVEQHRTISRAFLYPAVLSILLWASKCIFIVISPLRALAMSPWLIDDSFIFMRIARNLALGKGYSFDGVNPTGGAPLLWTSLTSLNHLFLGAEAAAKATIMGSSLFGMASALLVFYTAYRLFDNKIAWAAFLLSTLSAPMFFNSVNGMETSLFTFLGLLAVILYTEMEKLEGGKRDYLFLGCLLGLVNLVRADGVFLAFSIILIEGLTLFKVKAEDRRDYIVRIIALLIGIIVFTLPSVLWSLYASGTPFPANQIGRRFLVWEGVKLPDGTIAWPVYIQKVDLNTRYLRNLLSTTVGPASLAILSIIYGLLRKRGGLLSRLVTVYLVTYLGALVTYQGYFPNVHGLRYLNLPGHLLSILMAAFCYQVVTTDRRATFIHYALFAGIILSLILSSASRYRGMVHQLGWAKEMRIMPIYSESEVKRWWAFLDWVSGNLPEGTVIAAKDHGRLAYFTNTHVVDLAGIIDPSLIKHLQEGNIGSYLEGKGIEYVVLPAEGGYPVHRAIREVVSIERVPKAPHQEGYSLYRVNKAIRADEARANLDEAYPKLALSVMKDALLDLDFSNIVTEGNETYATAKTGQKVKIEGPVRMVDGPWEGSQALTVEEDSTITNNNPLLNGTYRGGLAPACFLGGDTSSITPSESTLHTQYGGKSQKLVFSDSAGSTPYFRQDGEYLPSTQYSVRVRLYIESLTTSVRVGIYDGSSPLDTDLTTVGWHEITERFTSPATISNERILVYSPSSDAATVYVDVIAVEPKLYVTSPFDGDSGDGYSWGPNGPHADTSTRQATRCEIDAAGSLDYASDHTVLVWMKLSHRSGVGPMYPAVFHYGQYYTDNSISLMFYRDGDALHLYARDNAGRWHQRGAMNNPVQDTDAYEADTWYMLGYRYYEADNRVDLIWDGQITEQDLGTAWPAVDNTYHKLGIGCRPNGNGNWSDGAVAMVAVFSRTLTDVEVTALYRADMSASR